MGQRRRLSSVRQGPEDLDMHIIISRRGLDHEICTGDDLAFEVMGLQRSVRSAQLGVDVTDHIVDQLLHLGGCRLRLRSITTTHLHFIIFITLFYEVLSLVLFRSS